MWRRLLRAAKRGATVVAVSVLFLAGLAVVAKTFTAAQGTTGWTTQVSGTTNVLFGVSCPSTSECFAVGDSGTIVATTDGGLAWTTQLSGTTNVLFGVSCPSTSECFAVGQGAAGAPAILATTNGGLTWTNQAVPAAVDELRGVSCSSISDCIAVGSAYDQAIGNNIGASVETTNGGSTWTSQGGMPVASGYLAGVSCPSTSDCFALRDSTSTNGYNNIMATNNGGATWTSQYSSTSIQFAGVSCPSTSDCFVVENTTTPGVAPPAGWLQNAILATTDGGATWTSQVAPTTSSNWFAAFCPSTSDCFVVGNSDTILATTDGGVVWVPQLLSTSPMLLGISCPSTSECFAVGNSGTIVATTDGGGTPSVPTTPTLPSTTTTSLPTTPGTEVVALQCDSGYSGGDCVAVTSAGLVYYDPSPTSSAWTQAPDSAPSGVVALQCDSGYAGGDCVAVTSTGLVYYDPSPTSSAWAQAPDSLPSGIVALQCDSGYSGAQCLAVTSAGLVYYDPSPTSSAWAQAPDSLPSGIVGLQCAGGYSFSSGNCVAVTSTGLVYYDSSPTSSAWTQAPDSLPSGVVVLQCADGYYNGHCVAITSTGVVYYDPSPTSSAWTQAPDPASSGIVALQCEDGVFYGNCVAVTSAGLVYYDPSPASSAWTQAPDSVTGPPSPTTTTPWEVALTATPSATTVGSAVTLLAAANPSVTGTGYDIEIFDQTTGVQVCSTASGNVCQTSVTEDQATSQSYVAYVASPSSTYPPPDIQASSEAVTVTWANTSLTPNPPTNVAATAGDQAASVTWQAPPPSTDSSVAPVSSYTVTASPGGQSATVSGSPPATSATVTGLTPGTTYTFSVYATNAAGNGPSSSPSNAVTPYGPPSAPGNVSATAGNGAASITWSASNPNGSPVSSYQVIASPGGNSSTVCGTCTSATVYGLTDGTSYSFDVYATNAYGTGPPSTSNSVIPYGPPGPPGNVSASAGNGEATVTWSAANPNGSTITSYTITSSGGQSTTACGGCTSAVVSGLSNGTTYTFSVYATNAAGAGSSATSNAATPYGPPDAPGSVSASPGNSQATVTWTAAYDNGSAITSYTITSSGGQSTSVCGTCSSATFSGLTNGTSYTFSVYATNAAGNGPSATSNSVTPAAPPTSAESVSATAGDTTAAVTWQPPGDDGGVPITAYQVQTWTSNGQTEVDQTNVCGTCYDYSVGGLTNGTSYFFEVFAENSNGLWSSGAVSNTVTPTDPATCTTTGGAHGTGYYYAGQVGAAGVTGIERFIQSGGISVYDTSSSHAAVWMGETVQDSSCPGTPATSGLCWIQVGYEVGLGGGNSGQQTSPQPYLEVNTLSQYCLTPNCNNGYVFEWNPNHLSYNEGQNVFYNAFWQGAGVNGGSNFEAYIGGTQVASISLPNASQAYPTATLEGFVGQTEYCPTFTANIDFGINQTSSGNTIDDNYVIEIGSNGGGWVPWETGNAACIMDSGTDQACFGTEGGDMNFAYLDPRSGRIDAWATNGGT